MSNLVEQFNHNISSDNNSPKDATDKLLGQLHQNGGSTTNTIDSSAASAAGDTHLPILHLADSTEAAPPAPSTAPGLLTEMGNVARELGTGALNEAEQHPLKLAEDLAIGAGVGLATGAAIGALGLGAALSSPFVVAGGVAVGLGVAGYETYKHWDGMVHDTKVVANPNAYSGQDVASARSDVQGFGAGTLEAGIKYAGASIGGPLGYFAGTAFRAAGSEAVSATTVAAVQSAATGDAKVAMATAVPTRLTPTPDTVIPASVTPAAQPFDPPPFTAQETSLTLRSPGQWQAIVARDGDDEFGRGILRFANAWATDMEGRLAAGLSMTPAMVRAASKESDPDFITGAMYGIARDILFRTWKYGPELMNTFGVK